MSRLLATAPVVILLVRDAFGLVVNRVVFALLFFIAAFTGALVARIVDGLVTLETGLVGIGLNRFTAGAFY